MKKKKKKKRKKKKINHNYTHDRTIEFLRLDDSRSSDSSVDEQQQMKLTGQTNGQKTNKREHDA
jgi:hypothetical protein